MRLTYILLLMALLPATAQAQDVLNPTRVKLLDGAGNVITSTGGALDASVGSLPLPAGAATEATLVTVDADTSAIAADTTSIDYPVVFAAGTIFEGRAKSSLGSAHVSAWIIGHY